MAITRHATREIASEISKSLELSDTDSDSIALVARRIADVLKREKPTFRYDYFFDACGLDSFGYVKGTVHA